MFKPLNNKENLMVLVYPNNQRDTADPFLRFCDFQEPKDLLNTHCTDVEVVWQNKEQTCLREFKTPQLVTDVELIVRTSETEGYFLNILETFKEFTEGMNISQILNLYCVLDETISKCHKEDLVIEERTAQNYFSDSETFAA